MAITETQKITDLLHIKTKLLNDAFEDLRNFKELNPNLKSGYKYECGSILNAYREGDISFSVAKIALQTVCKQDNKEIK